MYSNDSDLDAKVKKATERISENMHIVANEPSLAFYRLQEHVRKALPPMVERRVEVTKLHNELQGRCYDVEYAVSAVKGMDGASKSLISIQEMLKNAIFLKQQLKYEEARKNKKDSSSVYKRLSAHITLDLPDLPDLSGVMRETTNRVENMMAHARNSSSYTTASELQRSHTTLH
ncbi:BLOC-1-related complex subunit 8 homolog [Arctopsyche grandis]|uniref:BLOC-1-related complex subunit 8 homolog n=1 Tax=Arctopsyche grandis TaxID=121162 RepID=UPI00406D817E